MALVFDQLSNALLAETGAKRLIKKNNTQTGKQQQQVNKQCSTVSTKEQAGAIGQPITHIRIVDSTGQGRPATSRPFTARHDGRKQSPSPSRTELCSKTSASMHTTS